MPSTDLLSFQFPSSEIFVGLVGPVGSESDVAVRLITEALASMRYSPLHIELSPLLSKYYSKTIPSNTAGRYTALMDAGDTVREGVNRGDGVALIGLIDLWNLRDQETKKRIKAGEEPKSKKPSEQRAEDTPPKPLFRTAFIFDQLKHPKEVETLRWIYDRSFFLIGVYTPNDARLSNLVSKLANTQSTLTPEEREKLARDLMTRDRRGGKLGQNVEKTFPLSDVFINTADQDQAILSLKRFFGLVLGNPFDTPTIDEQGMFFAKSAAMRSSDLARQIGAAITTPDGDLLAVGCNDAAKFGGGQYWTGDKPDYRDFKRQFDSNDLVKKGILSDVLVHLLKGRWLKGKKLKDIENLSNEIFSDKTESAAALALKDSQLMAIIEYFRSVHAEMAALVTASRLGISVRNGTLYCTTFPCHECAKHIVAAGIRRVIYVEPYPKSRVAELYPDSIAVDNPELSASHVCFEPFVGIAPRQYLNLFELGKIDRKLADGRIKQWSSFEADTRMAQPSAAYLEKEKRFLATFKSKLEELAGISASATSTSEVKSLRSRKSDTVNSVSKKSTAKKLSAATRVSAKKKANIKKGTGQ